MNFSSFPVSIFHCFQFPAFRIKSVSSSFSFQHQEVERGHNGEPGVLAARPVEEDYKHARAPAVRKQKNAKDVAPSHSFVGPQGVQVTAIAIASIYKTQFLFYLR